MEDRDTRSEQERNRININEENELRYWKKKLNISEQRLREAVKAAGPEITDIRVWLLLDDNRKSTLF